MKKYYVFFAILVLFSIIVTVFQTSMSKGYKTDAIKESDLPIIQESISTYGTTHHKLPQSISEAKLYTPLQGKLSDYTYTITDYNKYSLCADFAHSRLRPADYYSPMGTNPDPSYHKSGNVCTSYTETAIASPIPR